MSVPDPIDSLKRHLRDELVRAIGPRDRWDVATLLGIHASRISELRRGKLERFSLETLIRFCVSLRQRVTIGVEPDRERRGPQDS
jgi:hypothetical protein